MPPKGWRKYPDGFRPPTQSDADGTPADSNSATPNRVPNEVTFAPPPTASISKDKKDSVTLDVSINRFLISYNF